MFTNLDFLHSASSAQLKDFYCKDRECGRCQFGGITCGFMSWLFSEHFVKKPELPNWAEEPIEELGLKPSVYAILRINGINTLWQLYQMRRYDLAELDGIGVSRATDVADLFKNLTGEDLPL